MKNYGIIEDYSYLRTTWSVFKSKMRIFGGHVTSKSSRDRETPASTAQRRLHESIFNLYTEMSPISLQLYLFKLIVWCAQSGYAWWMQINNYLFMVNIHNEQINMSLINFTWRLSCLVSCIISGAKCVEFIMKSSHCITNFLIKYN